jgi:hypothetical protein
MTENGMEDPSEPESAAERTRKYMELSKKVTPYDVYRVERQMTNRKGCIGNLIVFGSISLSRS